LGGIPLKGYIEERAIELAGFIIENNATVRAAAKKFGISKSTVHKDVTERLAKINTVLAEETKKVLEKNKAERHIRGGMATKAKYKQRSEAMLKKKRENDKYKHG
jgi:putative DeoR family transcriptional regulator (stage III sporulation protein D)